MIVESRVIRQGHLGVELWHVLMLPHGHGPWPAVLLIHEYTGLNSVILGHAQRLVEAGYAVLAADFYGVENRPENIDQARTIHRLYRNDRLLMRNRAQACLQALVEQPDIDPQAVFALGLSFGGGAVLELARTGADLKGAVSIYGYLDTTHHSLTEDIKAPLLVLFVEDDPVVPAEHARQFEDEMSGAGVRYEFIRIENARHGFANPEDAGFDEALAEWMWESVMEWMRPEKDYDGLSPLKRV
ncbi:dienelactone hydrolase family protein [Maridesulfovibrio sp. FT414]|uniref:dienelactone hydrolase family protein n=1 Tax=Maridesulfovibrio sp. FT414 TaxID=2979469 RepID=UPI003D801651